MHISLVNLSECYQLTQEIYDGMRTWKNGSSSQSFALTLSNKKIKYALKRNFKKLRSNQNEDC